MDEVVIAATLRNKLRQRLSKKSNVKREQQPKTSVASVADEDKRLEHEVQEKLETSQRQTDDKPTGDECLRFFASQTVIESQTDGLNDKSDKTALLLYQRYSSGIGKYQQEAATTQRTLVSQQITSQVPDITLTGKNFMSQPVMWPSDLLDMSPVNDESKLKYKHVLLSDRSSLSAELTNQLSIPLLKSVVGTNEADLLQRMDPDDIQTKRLKEILKSFEKRENKSHGVTFTNSVQDVMSGARMRMLHMRSTGELSQSIPVPLNEREIPLNLLVKNDDKNKDSVISSSSSSFNHIYDRKMKANALRSHLRQQLFSNSQSKLQPTLDDLVHEEESTAFDFAVSLISIKKQDRPLHPVRKERKKKVASSSETVSLIVTILHATHLPIRVPNEDVELIDKRRQSLRALNLESESSNNASSGLVNPFVELVFQRDIKRTTTAEGSNATWNQTLELNIKTDDPSPDSLSNIKDNIILNLYDEFIEYEKTTNYSEETDMQIPAAKMEKRFLGSISIPFSTLFLNTRIDGTFALKSPIALFGYEFESNSDGNRKGHRVNTRPNNECILLTLFMTMDPPLVRPQQPEPVCLSNEDDSLFTYTKAFESEFVNRFPDRKFRALVVTTECKWTLVTRYLSPVRPPDVFHDSLVLEEVMSRIARYVSLIPVCEIVKHIWLTMDQFMNLGIGDEEEHSVLLCNYFLYLGRRSGLVVGIGIPEGNTTYVITYDREISLWNATTGHKFAITDSFIPLTSVSAIITAENIFVNIQPHTHPTRIDFDVTRINCWMPLFSNKTEKLFPNLNLGTIQPDKLLYQSIDSSDIKRLQEMLDRHIKSCLMKWRPKSVTLFNRSTSQKLRKILSRIERHSQSKRDRELDLKSELQDVFNIYNVTGFPLHLIYTDVDSVTEAVFSTSVHVTDDPKVEFAVATHISSYPAAVISLSLYVAALHLTK